MACTLETTTGGASANSYCSIADADSFHDTVVQYEGAFAWDDAIDDEKCRALQTATRTLDAWYDWYGDITSLSQRLLWPRRGVLRPGVSEGAYGTASVNPWHEPFGALLPSDEIPRQLLEATAELARWLLVSDRNADSDVETQGIKSITAGPVSLTFQGAMAKPLPDTVQVMVSGLGTKKSKSGSGGVTMYRA
jgi:hypothetical protein